MTSVVELASIKEVDIRRAWPNESLNFTPWLADNLKWLGDAMGLELELQGREAAVGSFSLDILAQETGSSRQVIIENQLEITDHNHLGQLLTYASGYDAKVIVWIAREFKDEHRQALDWLNQLSPEETEFFGVVIELWKIGSSPPAPHFKVVSSPNDWRKGNIRPTSVPSERNERYRAYFQRLIDTLREERRITSARKGQPQSWYEFATCVAGFKYSAFFASDSKAKVGVYIDSGQKEQNEEYFELLKDQHDTLSTAFNEPLQWLRLDNRRACRIVVEIPGSIDDDEESLNRIHDWMVENIMKFRSAFGPKFNEL